ncbi:dihydrofolate reductase family protein [Tsukamurella sp. 8F]|uniref:dihydrofolate reductase family protein n=1 Tax=unclassified Tsukamurella TaxID=2633480 RepID=UPI0023BA1AEB|nr:MULTISPECIES: dihydrofolate reductase family protein [unclassified Tsukamurella]MDF0530118.1 dihydrofolate reductase family protein [Tsukamurella sp. 8J]MDF0586436.1 dihydrofolate reductase family protein [Tsukamurella sp. 8F]
MGTLTFTATMSIDGYVNDAAGDFQWSGPRDDVFALHIERMKGVSVEVLGRRTYELMQYWQKHPDQGPEADLEFARRWRAIDKVVASSTLAADGLGSPRDRLVADLDLDELRRIVDDATGAVEIFGPTVAATAIRAGLVEDYHFFVVPMVVGGGTRALPDDVRLELRLAEHRIFGNGLAYLHYTTD